METVGICGAGLIGASWAIGFANAGFKCLVYDSNDESFDKFEGVSNQLNNNKRDNTFINA